MEAAIRSLAQLPAIRYTAVLGLMAELGDESESEHQRIVEVAAALGVRIISFGDAEYGRSGTVLGHAADVAEAVAMLGELTGDDAVLVKGSRVAGLERVAAALLD